MEGRAGRAYLLLVLLALVCRLLIGRIVGSGGLLLEQAGGVDPPGGHAVVLGRHHRRAWAQRQRARVLCIQSTATPPFSQGEAGLSTAEQRLL